MQLPARNGMLFTYCLREPMLNEFGLGSIAEDVRNVIINSNLTGRKLSALNSLDHICLLTLLASI